MVNLLFLALEGGEILILECFKRQHELAQNYPPPPPKNDDFPISKINSQNKVMLQPQIHPKFAPFRLSLKNHLCCIKTQAKIRQNKDNKGIWKTNQDRKQKLK